MRHSFTMRSYAEDIYKTRSLQSQITVLRDRPQKTSKDRGACRTALVFVCLSPTTTTQFFTTRSHTECLEKPRSLQDQIYSFRRSYNNDTFSHYAIVHTRYLHAFRTGFRVLGMPTKTRHFFPTTSYAEDFHWLLSVQVWVSGFRIIVQPRNLSLLRHRTQRMFRVGRTCSAPLQDRRGGEHDQAQGRDLFAENCSW